MLHFYKEFTPEFNATVTAFYQNPHGDFGAWLVENVTVSERQAQRYMRHAKGLPILRTISKSDTVSVLNNDAESIAKIVAESEIVASIEAFKLAMAETQKPRDIAINAACESVVKYTPTLALAGAMVANQ